MISDGHRSLVTTWPILSQEMHAVAFTSGSIRSIDLTNVLTKEAAGVTDAKERGIRTRRLKKDIEILRPILHLIKNGKCPCESLIVSGNPLTRFDIDELGKNHCPVCVI
jgi:hypothetical protein